MQYEETSTDEPLVWNARLELGRPEIDIHHRYLVELINRIGHNISTHQSGSEAMTDLLQQLWSFAEYHFSAEESLMQHHHIDARHQRPHIAEHDDFFAQLKTCRDGLAMEPESSARKLHDYLTGWLEHHILVDDKQLIRQISAIEAGQSPEQAFLKNRPEDTTTLQ